MFLAALLNFRVNRIATSPPMLDENADPQAVLYVRVRGLSVLLGALTAGLISIILPAWGQLGLITIPIWRPILLTIARRRASRAAAA